MSRPPCRSVWVSFTTHRPPLSRPCCPVPRDTSPALPHTHLLSLHGLLLFLPNRQTPRDKTPSPPTRRRVTYPLTSGGPFGRTARASAHCCRRGNDRPRWWLWKLRLGRRGLWPVSSAVGAGVRGAGSYLPVPRVPRLGPGLWRAREPRALGRTSLSAPISSKGPIKAITARLCNRTQGSPRSSL